MITVKLLGELGKKFGKKHTLAITSPAEAVRALCANFPDFEKFVISSSDRGVGYKVLSGKTQIGVEQLHDPASKSVTIAPVLIGAGGSVGKIVLGATLIAASIFLPGFGMGGSAVFWDAVFSIGVSLAISGVAQMLSPVPPTNGPVETQTDPSYLFNGPLNTTAQGHPVPIGYGRLLIGSAVISAGIVTEEIPT